MFHGFTPVDFWCHLTDWFAFLSMMKVYKVFLVKKIENLLVDFISVQKIILLLYETMFVGALMKCSDYLTHKEQNRSYLAI